MTVLRSWAFAVTVGELLLTGVRPSALMCAVIDPLVPSRVTPGTKRTSNSSWPVVPGGSGLRNFQVARRVAGSYSARVTSLLPTTCSSSKTTGSGSVVTSMLVQMSLASEPLHS